MNTPISKSCMLFFQHAISALFYYQSSDILFYDVHITYSRLHANNWTASMIMVLSTLNV